MSDIVERLRRREHYFAEAADTITALRAEVEDLGNRLHHVHRLWANNEHALRAENERLKKRVEWHEHALHTCHDECDKPLCKATRENERLTAEIASLTEEFGIQNNDLGKALLENERLRVELREMDAHMEENITLTEALRHEQEWVLRLSKALRGIIRVADRNTVEFNEARAALAEKP